jgi:hypothetical protein
MMMGMHIPTFIGNKKKTKRFVYLLYIYETNNVSLAKLCFFGLFAGDVLRERERERAIFSSATQ